MEFRGNLLKVGDFSIGNKYILLGSSIIPLWQNVQPRLL
jgi:hypothetical protein